jgi:hypothetical protein
VIQAAPRKRYDFRGLVGRAHPEMTGEQELSGWHMLRQRGLLRERRTRRVKLALACALLGLTCFGVGFVLARPDPVQPLVYSMSGGRLDAAGVVRVQAEDGGLIRFSDGSVVRLLRSTAARLVHVGPHGARLRVSDGGLEVAVEPHPDLSFEFELGAYSLNVRDAAFAGQLRERDELLEVRVFSGSVELDGPLAGDGLTLRGGQVLTIRRSEGAIVVRDAKTDDLAGAAEVDSARAR